MLRESINNFRDSLNKEAANAGARGLFAKGAKFYVDTLALPFDVATETKPWPKWATNSAIVLLALSAIIVGAALGHESSLSPEQRAARSAEDERCSMVALRIPNEIETIQAGVYLGRNGCSRSSGRVVVVDSLGNSTSRSVSVIRPGK